MALHAILLVVCMAMSSHGQKLASGGYITHRFELDENYPPIKLLLDSANRTVYVSAVNRLYQLNKTLDRYTLIEVETGPKNDSIRCLPYGRCDAQDMDKLAPTDNYNKLFLMDSKRNRLIVCGSIYQGICETRSMFDIQDIVSDNPCKDNNNKCAYNDYSAIACLNENCTCVGVIAEGPTVNSPVIYIATTVIDNVFSKQNTISTRSLYINKTHENMLFGLTIDTISKNSRLMVPSEGREKFTALFKYTFATERLDGFVYFLFRKEGSPETLLARLCKQDPLLRSFITISVTCGVGGDSGEVVNAYYQKRTGSRDWNIDDEDEGSLYITFKNANGSSICLYTLRNINKAFDDGILACYKNKGQNSRKEEVVIADPEMNGNSYDKCPDSEKWMGADASLDDTTAGDSKSISLGYYGSYKLADTTYRCGQTYLPKGLKILLPLTSRWSYHQRGKFFSGLTVDLVDGINIAYIGTTDGDIIELDVNHKNVFNTIAVGSPVVGNLVLDNDPSLPVPHLYAMTRKEISLVKVSFCSKHTTCTDCLQAKDPYCGWCILSSSCVPKSTTCPSNSFLKPLSEQCIEATVQEPLERSLQQNVTVQVKLLPALSGQDSYKCLFDRKHPSSAKVDASNPEVIVCEAPDSNSLPNNFPEEDYVDVSLSIVYNDRTVIVSSIAKFYECEAHGKTINVLQPCQSCLDNQWKGKCSWCVQSNKCVPTGRGSSCLSSEKLCPMITTGNRSLILPVGIGTEIILDVENLPSQAANEMSCKVMIEDNQPVQVKASLVGDSRSQIKCARKQYKYSQNKSEVSATVSVYWKPNFAVDVESFSPVAFYKCTVSRGDCSLCVTANQEYKCGWCGSKCVIKELCSQKWDTDDTYCPGPVIASFAPMSGPLTGNTTVTIFGQDMGVRADDVDSITIAGVACIQQRELYQISNRITCVLESAATPNPRKGKVSVTVRGVRATSNEDFSFKSPILQSVATPEGPVSGGTSVNIIGTGLDVGGNKLVYIDKYECSNPEVLNATAMTCKSSAADEPSMNLSLSVLFDGHPVELQNAFSYIKDPEVTSYTTATDKLACFLAGGRNVAFTGKRLNIVQNAYLIAHLNKDVVDEISAAGRTRRHITFRKRLKLRLRRSASNEFQSFSSKCEVQNSTRMVCPTPEIHKTFGNDVENNISNSVKALGTLRLRMDNMNEEVIDPTSGKPAILTYYPNPNVLDLDPENVKQLQSGSLLDVPVVNLNPDAVDASEITIMIGEQRCPVESIKDKVIRCNIPANPSGDQTTFPVSVKIGNKKWDIGEASYVPPPTSVSIGLIVGVIFAIVLVVLGPLIGYCIWKQKHYKSNKNDFQKAIENLEMTVQADFRKAFAELSIDMTDLAADSGDVGIPVLSYRQYATNMFFPTYHPCMKEPNQNEKQANGGVHQGFVQFDLLIANKQFLMAFIRTLEQQRGFSNRDKANVASLITVVLHKKLDYFAEVMKSLVSELVAASVERNPKVLLRRTESVAERMLSNWLAICLFQHIRENAGKPLFLLQKAIKRQVSKGPLDAVTGKTKYTLSDDSLLKEDIPCDSLTLFVSQKETDPDDPIVVKVLSCDSIPQVKEKVMDAVYKKIPFSQRPKAEQLDLEWRHGRSGHLVLPDNDQVNEPGSRWRRVMTIKDYKVDSNATMALVQSEQKIDDADTSHYTNHSADTSVVSPMLPEDNVKVYHLVKYADDLEQKRESSILRDKHKHILDLYLLRLISMKGILQSYVDDAFHSILDTNSIPTAVKHFFDFLDELAKNHDVSNQEITHIWKTNGVLGRFWVTLLKNPELVFDVDKPESVASSMAVISQTFIDACSVQEHQPTKDSPINKQLYAKEIPTYKKLVQKYYADVRQMQPVSDQDMCAHMTAISRSHDLEFDVRVAHNELWGYVNKYYEEIQETLSSDPNMTQMVIQRLQQAYTLIYSSVNNP